MPPEVKTVIKVIGGYVVSSYILNFLLIKYWMIDHMMANNSKDFVSTVWLISPITFPLHLIFLVMDAFAYCMDFVTGSINSWW